jgi:hypothetical protein
MTSRAARVNRVVRRVTKRFGWLGGIAFVIGIGLIILVNEISPSHVVRVTPTAQSLATTERINDLGRLGFTGLWVGIALAVVGVIAFALWLDQRYYRAMSRPAQIQTLTRSLTTAMNVIASINSEVQEGQRVLAELESRTATAEVLAKLSEDQAEAVQNAIDTTIRGERRFALTSQVVIGVVAGLIAGFLLGHL